MQTVLIVHRAKKDFGLADTLERLTSHLGYTAMAFYVGPQTKPDAVQHYVNFSNPDLIFLAENFGKYPNKNGEGIEALYRIRDSNPSTPIYMISSSPAKQREAQQGGANGYLSPNFGLEEISRILGAELNHNLSKYAGISRTS